MKRILSLCALFMATCNLYAQKPLQGYYVSNTNDTVNISVIYYPSEDNPRVINCVAGGAEKKLTPDSCLGFTIPGYVQFVSKKTKRLINPISIDYPASNYESTDVYENINSFLKVIFASPSYTLYKYHDAARVNYFLEDSAGNFVELRYKIIVQNSIANEQKIYIRQLKNQFYKQLEQDKKAAKYIDQLAYTENDLVTFLQMVTGYKSPKEQKVRYPNAFVSLNSGLVFMTGTDKEKVNMKMGGLCAGAGMGLIYYTGDVMERSFFSPQLRFSTFQFESRAAYTTTKATTTKIDLLISIGTAIKINPKLQWIVSAAPTASVILTRGTEGVVGNYRGEVTLQTGFLVNRKLCISLVSGIFGTKMYSTYENEILSQRAITLNVDWRFHL